jgi:hypothetical protein
MVGELVPACVITGVSVNPGFFSGSIVLEHANEINRNRNIQYERVSFFIASILVTENYLLKIHHSLKPGSVSQ